MKHASLFSRPGGLVAFASTCAAALAMPLCANAEPVSGVMRDGSEWTGHTWTTRDLWDYQTYAKDGGEATLLAENHGSHKLDMNVSGLTLSGLMIDRLTSPFYSANGYSISMCGASPYIGRNAMTEFQLELPLVGDGTNILRKTGAGLIRFDAPVQNFGSFVVWDGIVSPSAARVTNPAIVDSGVPLVLRGGQVKFDSSASDGAPETTLGELRLAPGSARMTVANGSTVTVGALSREQGGIAVLSSANGIDALGATEKLVVSGRASDASGELDGSVVTIDEAADPHPLDFVTYDGTDGFKRAGAGTALASGVDVTGIADVSEATTVSDNTSVSALRIKDGAQLTVGSGATLSVGDGTHPAGVLFQSSAASTTAGAVNGDGTLAFGDKEGVFWFSCGKSDNARKYAFATKVSGSAGVTFAARRISASSAEAIPYVTFASGYTPGWTGPTHIAGLRVTAGTAVFPGDVWVDGNTQGNSAQLQFDVPRTWTQRVHLSSMGISSSADNAALYFNYTSYSGLGTNVFSGGVEVLSSSSITAKNTAIAQFASPITGVGGLALSVGHVGGYMSFDATNTYSGATKFTSDAYGSLIVNSGGTLGAGPVEMVSGNLLFADQAGAVVSNAITGAGGILRFRDSTASLSGNVDIGKLRLGEWTNTTEIAVRNLAAGEITAERTCKITAVDASSVLTVGTNGMASAISCKLEDGAGKLSLVKRGANTVDVLGRKSYTGSTTVKAGTLRLQNNITNCADVVWWVDASDESTVTTNGDGRVSKVASKNGNGVSFVQYSTFGLPYYDSTVNELKALRYACTDIVTKEDGTRADGSWLRGDTRVQQRTVIMVVKPRLTGISGNTGVFGAFGRDMGQRMTKGGWNSTWADASGSSYCTTGGFRQNGVKNDTRYYDDQASVVVMRQGTERLIGNYSANSDFNPALGGYATWGEKPQGYLGFNGDICEAIAFNRYLPDDEVKLIENYLSEKWQGSALNADAETMEELVEQSDLLPTATDLEIYPDATFDLNGVNQTVKTLSGQGRIVNSSATPATLTVTDGITFRGTIGSGVTLLKGDGSIADLELRVEPGATVGVTDGTLAVSPYVELPITNNIAFWCDASYRPAETILRDETDGGVTNWICRAGFVSNFTFNTANEYCVIKPTYSADSHGGRGAVKFSNGKCALIPTATCSLRTVFLVTKLGSSGSQYVFGRDHYDLSFRVTSSWFNLHGKHNFNPVGALFHLNGVDYTDAAISTLYPPAYPNPLLITACAESWQSDIGIYDNVLWDLGCNMNNNGNNQEMAEVIVYTNRLSDLEIAKVENYLMKKWGLKEGAVAAYDTAFADGASMETSGDGVFDAKGGAVEFASIVGSGGAVTNFSHLTVTDSIVLDVVNGVVDPLTIYGDVTFGTSANGYDIPAYVDDWHDLDPAQAVQRAVTVLSADGETAPTVAGGLHAAEEMSGWKIARNGNSWSVCRSGLLIIVR